MERVQNNVGMQTGISAPLYVEIYSRSCLANGSAANRFDIYLRAQQGC